MTPSLLPQAHHHQGALAGKELRPTKSIKVCCEVLAQMPKRVPRCVWR